MNKKNNFGIEKTDLTDIEREKLSTLIDENKHQANRIIETFNKHPEINEIIDKLTEKYSIEVIESERELFWYLGRWWLLSFKVNNEIRYLDISYSDLRLRISISDAIYEDSNFIYNPLVIKKFSDWMPIEDLAEFIERLLYMFGVK